MFTIEYAKNPIYVSNNVNELVITVKFFEFEEEIEFGANAWDKEPHGIELFNRAKAGDFGPITPFIQSPTANT